MKSFISRQLITVGNFLMSLPIVPNPHVTAIRYGIRLQLQTPTLTMYWKSGQDGKPGAMGTSLLDAAKYESEETAQAMVAFAKEFTTQNLEVVRFVPEVNDVELEVKGKATITVDFVMRYHTYGDDRDGGQGAIDILSDYEKEFFICEKIGDLYQPATTAVFSNLQIAEVADCITTVVTAN